MRSFVRLQEEIFLGLEREDCIVVHQYKNNGYNIVLDVNSGAIHVVDDLTYDVIPLFETHTTDEIVAALKDKYKEEEIKELFENNPQATGVNGRVMTQLRALKDQGFLIFSGNKTKPNITMTNFAFELISGKMLFTDIYAKMMIGLHSSNPARTSMLNKARVFLNTIFVIDLLKKEWQKLGNEAKGILKYEFSFVLGMKDCDYKKCVKDILTYRKIYGLKENKDYIKKYLFDEMGLEKLSYQSLNDYTNEVFRKFEMTGLLIARGKFGHIYYDFSAFNLTKIESLLCEYKNYTFKEFKSVTEYIDFLSNIKLPWLVSEKVRKELIENKAKKQHLCVVKILWIIFLFLL